MDGGVIKTAALGFVRHCVFWILVPNVLFYLLIWWLSRKKPQPAPLKKPKVEETVAQVFVKPEAPMWSEIKYQTSRTDFLASCSVATLDELRYRKDRVLAMQDFMRKPSSCKKVSAQALESINERLDLQLCAVDNWINLKLQTRARPALDDKTRSDFELFCRFVKFRESRR
jgi:hypothetical protein